MYMANARPNARGPNANYIPLAIALGVCVGGNANFMFRVGGNANFSVLDTNMLVSPARNFRVGGLDQCKTPTQELCGAVEYKPTKFPIRCEKNNFVLINSCV